jgi:colicin import membrane protein
MMNYKLGFILFTCAAFSNADSIHIPSTSTPEGMSLEKYNELSALLNPSNDVRAKANVTAKADASAKRRADMAAQARADAVAKAKADAMAKAKFQADTKKASTEPDTKYEIDFDHKSEHEKASAAQKANEAAAMKKAEAKKIASSAKRDFENKIKKAWILPENTSGQKAIVRVFLTESGAVSAVVVNATDPDVKESVEQAVRSAAPYPMPSDPDARSQAKTFTASFTVK